MQLMARLFFRLLAAGLVVAALAATDAQEQREINVSSDRVEYADDDVLFSGDVLMQAGGLSVHAATLRVENDENGNRYFARGATVSVYCDDCASVVLRAEAGEEIAYDAAADRLRMSGGVHVCADDDCALGNVAADTADWRRGDGMLRLRGEPVRARWQPPDAPAPIIAEAARILYNLVSGEVMLEGGGVVTRGDSEVRGEVINVNVKTGTLSAESAPEQRVRATF